MNQNWPSQNQGQNNNEKEFRPGPPPPPPPEITLRTMQSDVDSLKQTGGQGPIAKPISPAPSAQPKAELNKLSDSAMQSLKPANIGAGKMPGQAPEVKTGSGKKITLVVVILLIIAGAGYAGYKYIYPKYFPSTTVDTSAPSTQEPVTTPATQPVVTEVPAVVPEATTTTSGVTEPVATTTPAIVLKTHTSLFSTAADSQANVALGEIITISSLKQAMLIEASNKPAATTALKELNLSEENEGQLVFAEILPLFASQITTVDLSAYFSEDFTTFLYYDANGAWPGFVAKLKTGASVTAAKTLMSKIETPVSNISNFYLVAPGTANVAGFKTGAASARYLPFSKTGASFNYGWSGNYLVISASYAGYNAAVAKLAP